MTPEEQQQVDKLLDQIERASGMRAADLDDVLDRQQKHSDAVVGRAALLKSLDTDLGKLLASSAPSPINSGAN